MAGLAMMPRESVIVSFQQMREDSQLLADLPIASLLNYFENTWLSDLDIWNVYRVDSRNNNTCECNKYVTITTSLTIFTFYLSSSQSNEYPNC